MEHVLFEIKQGVGIISLNRPEKYNAFIMEMALAMQKALDICKTDPSIRAVLITGEGKAFCAGQDLNEAVGEHAVDLSRIISQAYNPIIRRIRELEKPVVCGVNGVAAGAGANIALACDIVIAAESASFIQAFSKIGLIPDSGGTYTLPRLIGMQRATAMMMLGDKVSAAEAAAIGMIYRSFPNEAFEEECWKLVKKLADMPTRGLGLTKRALNKSLASDLDTQLAIEEQLQEAASQTEDFQEGVNAFLEKRKPVFKGQ